MRSLMGLFSLRKKSCVVSEPAMSIHEHFARKRTSVHNREEKPSNKMLSSDSRIICCEVCAIKTVFKCRGCNVAYYCSQRHQKQDWIKHKRICKIIYRRKIESIPPSQVKHLDSSKRGPEDCFIDAKALQCYEQLVSFVFRALMKTGICVIDNFVHDSIADGIMYETQALHMNGEFRKACASAEDSEYRGDEIAWVTGNEKLCQNIKFLNKTYGSLIKSLKLGDSGQGQLTHKSHVQLACYPKSSMGYTRRVDNQSGDGRLLTTVYHCNKDYGRERCGGVSRYYFLKTKFVDIEPKFNRAVLHWSDKRVVHEVLPCREKLFSLTSWYLDCTRQHQQHQKSANTRSLSRVLMNSSPVKNCKTKIIYRDELRYSAALLHDNYKEYEQRRFLLKEIDQYKTMVSSTYSRSYKRPPPMAGPVA